MGPPVKARLPRCGRGQIDVAMWSHRILSGRTRQHIAPRAGALDVSTAPQGLLRRSLPSPGTRWRPILKDGNIESIEELDGYGPLLLAAAQRGGEGDDVALFGENRDSPPLYLF